MQEEDIQTVSDLAARIWHAHYPDIISRQQIEYMLERMYSPASLRKQLEDGHHFLIAEENDNVVGYAAIEPRGPGKYFLHKLYVDTLRHQQGIGSILLKQVMTECKPAELSLHVNRANIKAINFYFKQGFSIAGLQVTDIGNGYVMDDFVMRWNAGRA